LPQQFLHFVGGVRLGFGTSAAHEGPVVERDRPIVFMPTFWLTVWSMLWSV